MFDKIYELKLQWNYNIYKKNDNFSERFKTYVLSLYYYYLIFFEYF